MNADYWEALRLNNEAHFQLIEKGRLVEAVDYYRRAYSADLENETIRRNLKSAESVLAEARDRGLPPYQVSYSQEHSLVVNPDLSRVQRWDITYSFPGNQEIRRVKTAPILS